ncbi:MAG: substrate-binding domain-containing protein [Gemmatimonadaceae bacterium]
MQLRPTTHAAGMATIALLVLAAFACGGGDQPGAKPATSGQVKTFRIAMIAKSSTNPVFLSARVGAERAAAELSKTNGVEVKIDWLTPPSEDGVVQAQRIAQAVNDGDNAILIAASDAGKVTGAIDAAVSRGVPVMMFDSDAPASKRFAFYGADDVAAGRQVMAELATQMNDTGAVAILAGNQNAPNLQKRVQGVKDEAKKHPGIHIIDTFNHIETPQDAAAEVTRAQNANPNIRGWAMVGAWALFTPSLLRDLQATKVKMVAIDALPAELPYVEQGLAPVLLAQPTYLWGDVSVRTIFDHVYLKKPVSERVQMDLVRVSKDNLGEWARKLRDWGFTDVDPKYLALPR